jgi:serine/threonine protein kinase
VEVTDFGKATDGTVFFVMELLVGEPLDAVLARERRLDLLRSITICNQLAAALGAAHGKGIIHRDLKPENVMLISREGRRELIRRVNDDSGAHDISERETRFDFVKILDFGVAKVREPDTDKGRVTQAGVVFGTPEYMAPETARIGFSDARSDIYALGVMFFEMLTGMVPFTGEAPVDVMMKQVNEEVPRLHDVAPDAEITEETETMIRKALAKDPEQRQQSMEEFHRDLQKCYGHVRFRRSVRTPPGQAAAVIPLTKKKTPPSDAANGAKTPIVIEMEAGIPSPLAPSTTPLPGDGPILLTKKKPRAEAAPPVPQAPPTVTPTPVPEKPVPEKKKRTTLPLGMEGSSAIAPAPPPQEPPQIKTARYPGPGHLNEHGAAVPHAAAAARVSGPGHEPRVPGAPPREGDKGDELDRSWMDEPTAPGASGNVR